MNPYLVLGVARNADDRQIRQVFLEAVKKATPDTQPEQFKQLSTAYEAIKDEKQRINHALFDRDIPGNTPLDAYLRFVRIGAKPKPLPFEAMKDYLRACQKT